MTAVCCVASMPWERHFSDIVFAYTCGVRGSHLCPSVDDLRFSKQLRGCSNHVGRYVRANAKKSFELKSVWSCIPPVDDLRFSKQLRGCSGHVGRYVRANAKKSFEQESVWSYISPVDDLRFSKQLRGCSNHVGR